MCFPFDSAAPRISLDDLPLHSFLEDTSQPMPVSRACSKPPALSPCQPRPFSCGVCADPRPCPAPVTTPATDTLVAEPDDPIPSDSNASSEPLGSAAGSDSDDDPPASPNPAPSVSIPTPLDPSPAGHPMITRAKAGIFKPRHQADLAHTSDHGLYSALFASTDPSTHHDALRDPKWVAAMRSEMHALSRNATWSLVPRPPNTNVVGCRWLFRTKYLADGSIDRHKARLVAQGFSQVPGLDCSHTFSPVVKAATIRVVLTLAVINQWKLHQLDVNNAFLHGNLTDIVYMKQPPGFIDPRYPDHACKLHKAMYGLQQAPRAWFHRLSSFLVTNGFVCSRADPSLFNFKRGACVLYLLVYVDDLILTGSDSSLIRSFIHKLHAEFKIKDLGQLNYFLGLEAKHLPSGLFLSQSKYAHSIVDRAGLLDSKPVSTPLAADT